MIIIPDTASVLSIFTEKCELSKNSEIARRSRREKKKMKTNQKTSSEPQEAKCMQTVIQNKQGKYFSQWERGGKKLKTWIGILSIFISWWWYFIEWLRIDLSAW